MGCSWADGLWVAVEGGGRGTSKPHRWARCGAQLLQLLGWRLRLAKRSRSGGGLCMRNSQRVEYRWAGSVRLGAGPGKSKPPAWWVAAVPRAGRVGDLRDNHGWDSMATTLPLVLLQGCGAGGVHAEARRAREEAGAGGQAPWEDAKFFTMHALCRKHSMQVQKLEQVGPAQ